MLMPVDKCKFGVFKGITVHMLYYYYYHYDHLHRCFWFFKLYSSHTSETEVSPRTLRGSFSDRRRREYDKVWVRTNLQKQIISHFDDFSETRRKKEK